MKYIKLLLSVAGLIVILFSKKRYEQARRRFIIGENDGIISFHGLRLYLSNISDKELHIGRNNLWNSEFSLILHKKKDDTNAKIEFFINIFKDYINNILSNIDTFMEIGAGNGKNIIAINDNFSNIFSRP